MCKPPRQVGVEPRPRRPQEPRENLARCGRRPNVRARAAPWAPGALSPAELRRREAKLGVSQEVPGQRCIPAAHPREPRLPGSRGRRRNEERRWRPLCPRVRGARKAEREAGWPRACVRAWPESYGAGDPRPERPAWFFARSQRSCCTDTHPLSSTECPPSTRRPRWPQPRLGQRDPAPSPGLVRLAENLLIFFFPLHSSPLWSGRRRRRRRQGDGGSTRGKAGDDQGRLLFFLKDAFASYQCGFCEPSY